MANKSSSRSATARRGSPSNASTARTSRTNLKSAPKRTLTAVVGGKARQEVAVVKRAARGALREVSSGVHHLSDGALELGSSAVKNVSNVGRSVGTFASDNRYALALGALSLGLFATARQLSAASGAGSGARAGGVGTAGKPPRAVRGVDEGAEAGVGQEVLERAEAGYARVQIAAQTVFQANPLLIGGAVLSAGLALGFALPASAREKELLEDVGKGLASKGKQSIDDVISRAEQTVQAATNVGKLVSAAFGR